MSDVVQHAAGDVVQDAAMDVVRDAAVDVVQDAAMDVVQDAAVDVVPDVAVDVVIAAARVFAAVTAESIAQAGQQVTLPQLRVLTLAADSAPLRNSDVARALDIHFSNASRLCDRLVQADLLDRRDSATDRRQVELTLTAAGRRLVDAVTEHRRAVFTRLLGRMDTADRAVLVEALDGFVAAGQLELGRVTELP